MLINLQVSMRRLPVLSILLVCAGCAIHRPSEYRLVQQGGGPLLIPPGVAASAGPVRTFTADVVPAGRPCPAGASPITLHPRGRGFRVTVRREALAKQPPGWLGEWAAALEVAGCVAPGDGIQLATRIIESLPLEPSAAFRLLYRTAEGEFVPRTRIQVVGPILREGAPPDAPILEPDQVSGNGNTLSLIVRSTPNLIGYETAWYSVQPKAGRIGYSIAPLSAERRINGQVESLAQPGVNYFRFPAEAGFYRLFYKSEPTGLTALVVAARTQAELEQRTRTLEAGEASCEKLNGDLCVAIPKSVAVNVFLPVTINGKEVLVGWGANLRAAMRSAGTPQADAILPSLSVSKPYRGRLVAVDFDRTNPAIFTLVLTGGEVIAWK